MSTNNHTQKKASLVKVSSAQAARKQPGQQPIARNRLNAYGIDQLCADLVSGDTLTAVAVRLGVGVSSLLDWIEADADRSARTREARTAAARIWDEKAELGIQAAGDPFELAKAKELAHHYRWRAKAVAPKEYGDKVTQEVTGADGGPITLAAVDFKGLTDAELAQAKALLTKSVKPK